MKYCKRTCTVLNRWRYFTLHAVKNTTHIYYCPRSGPENVGKPKIKFFYFCQNQIFNFKNVASICKVILNYEQTLWGPRVSHCHPPLQLILVQNATESLCSQKLFQHLWFKQKQPRVKMYYLKATLSKWKNATHLIKFFSKTIEYLLRSISEGTGK